MKICNKYVVICDRDRPELAAIIVSYAYEKDTYLPVFEFPFVTCAKRERNPDGMDENSLSIRRAEEVATLINNAIARMKGCELLIYAGLSGDQKTYLNEWEGLNHISIDSMDEIDFYLSAHTNKRETAPLVCKPSQLLQGLFVALKNNVLLQFDEDAENLTLDYYNSNYLVVIEKDLSTAGLSSVVYAVASGADLKIVDELPSSERTQVFESIQMWRQGEMDAYTF